MPEQIGTMDTETWAALTRQLEDKTNGVPVSEERRERARQWAREALARISADRASAEHQAARARALGNDA